MPRFLAKHVDIWHLLTVNELANLQLGDGAVFADDVKVSQLCIQ